MPKPNRANDSALETTLSRRGTIVGYVGHRKEASAKAKGPCTFASTLFYPTSSKRTCGSCASTRKERCVRGQIKVYIYKKDQMNSSTYCARASGQAKGARAREESSGKWVCGEYLQFVCWESGVHRRHLHFKLKAHPKTQLTLYPGDKSLLCAAAVIDLE